MGLHRSQGNDLFKEVEHDIHVESYAPKVFQVIRDFCKINDASIIQSVDPKRNRFQIFKTNTG